MWSFCLDNSPTDSPSIKVNSGPLLPSPTPTTTECTVLVETKQSMYLCHPPTHLYEVYTSRLESHQCKQGNIAINLIGSTLYFVITAVVQLFTQTLLHSCRLQSASNSSSGCGPRPDDMWQLCVGWILVEAKVLHMFNFPVWAYCHWNWFLIHGLLSLNINIHYFI